MPGPRAGSAEAHRGAVLSWLSRRRAQAEGTGPAGGTPDPPRRFDPPAVPDLSKVPEFSNAPTDAEARRQAIDFVRPLLDAAGLPHPFHGQDEVPVSWQPIDRKEGEQMAFLGWAGSFNSVSRQVSILPSIERALFDAPADRTRASTTPEIERASALHVLTHELIHSRSAMGAREYTMVNNNRRDAGRDRDDTDTMVLDEGCTEALARRVTRSLMGPGASLAHRASGYDSYVRLAQMAGDEGVTAILRLPTQRLRVAEWEKRTGKDWAMELDQSGQRAAAFAARLRANIDAAGRLTPGVPITKIGTLSRAQIIEALEQVETVAQIDALAPAIRDLHDELLSEWALSLRALFQPDDDPVAKAGPARGSEAAHRGALLSWANRRKSAQSEVVPPPIGTAPIPPGTERRFHVSPKSNLEAIRRDGLTMRAAKGIEGPRAIYSWGDAKAAKSYAGAGNNAVIVEFWMPKGSFDDHPYAVARDVPPSQIVAIHEPWHEHYRYAVENHLDPSVMDGIDDDYDRAAAVLRRTVAKAGPGRPGPAKGSQTAHEAALKSWANRRKRKAEAAAAQAAAPVGDIKWDALPSKQPEWQTPAPQDKATAAARLKEVQDFAESVADALGLPKQSPTTFGPPTPNDELQFLMNGASGFFDSQNRRVVLAPDIFVPVVDTEAWLGPAVFAVPMPADAAEQRLGKVRTLVHEFIHSRSAFGEREWQTFQQNPRKGGPEWKALLKEHRRPGSMALEEGCVEYLARLATRKMAGLNYPANDRDFLTVFEGLPESAVSRPYEPFVDLMGRAGRAGVVRILNKPTVDERVAQWETETGQSWATEYPKAQRAYDGFRSDDDVREYRRQAAARAFNAADAHVPISGEPPEVRRLRELAGERKRLRRALARIRKAAGRPGPAKGSEAAHLGAIRSWANRRRAQEQAETLVGITSAREGYARRDAVLGRDLRAFRGRLAAIGDVRGAVVEPGEGAYMGGVEPTWVTSYKGNGQARAELARTAKAAGQMAVLMLHRTRASDPNGSPMTEFTFPRPMSAGAHRIIGNMLGSLGIGGWTWYKTGVGQTTALRVAHVPQWSSQTPAQFTDAMAFVERVFAQSRGFTASRTDARVRVEVLDASNYDAAIAEGDQRRAA